MTETLQGWEEWWEDPKELARFARWFDRRFGFTDVDDVLNYLGNTEAWMQRASRDEEVELWAEYQADLDIPL